MGYDHHIYIYIYIYCIYYTPRFFIILLLNIIIIIIVIHSCCNSTEESKENKKWNQQLATEKRKDQSVKKLLFLGSGGSGKSTLFKQLRTLHGAGYADKDRLQFKDHIYAQVVEQMRLCLECIEILKEEEADEYKDVQLSDAGKQAADQLQSAPTLQVWSQFNYYYLIKNRKIALY